MNERQILERKIELYKQALQITRFWEIRLIIKILWQILRWRAVLKNAK